MACDFWGNLINADCDAEEVSELVPFYPYDNLSHNTTSDQFIFSGEIDSNVSTHELFVNWVDYDVYVNNSLLIAYGGTTDKFWDNDTEWGGGANSASYLSFYLNSDGVNAGYTVDELYADWAGGNQTGYVSDSDVSSEVKIMKDGVIVDHFKLQALNPANPRDVTITYYVGGWFMLASGGTTDNVTIVDER